MDSVELQAIIFQYVRAYLSSIQRCFPEDKQLSDYMKANITEDEEYLSYEDYIGALETTAAEYQDD